MLKRFQKISQKDKPIKKYFFEQLKIRTRNSLNKLLFFNMRNRLFFVRTKKKNKIHQSYFTLHFFLYLCKSVSPQSRFCLPTPDTPKIIVSRYLQIFLMVIKLICFFIKHGFLNICPCPKNNKVFIINFL